MHCCSCAVLRLSYHPRESAFIGYSELKGNSCGACSFASCSFSDHFTPQIPYLTDSIDCPGKKVVLTTSFGKVAHSSQLGAQFPPGLQAMCMS